ncbi:MAG: hydroxyisourate hydrolase [Nigerium sp.]|nr:hydroxyisourate hydrolase [Nigerium sp.]
MSHLTTHVLDASSGTPAAGVGVTLTGAAGQAWSSVTDADGRLGLGPGVLPAGDYELVFATGAYFASRDIDAFYPSVTVTFTVAALPHYHVPLILSPFAYSTYRGS